MKSALNPSAALRAAAAAGDMPALLAALPQAFTQSTDDQGRTALIIAARHNRVEAVRALAPVSPLDAEDLLGHTALLSAAAHDCVEACEALLEFYDPLKPNKRGYTALMVATCNPKTLAFLLPLSDVNAKRSLGDTALSLAVINHSDRGVEILLSSGLVDREEAARACEAAIAENGPKMAEAFSDVIPPEQIPGVLDRFGSKELPKLMLRWVSLEHAALVDSVAQASSPGPVGEQPKPASPRKPRAL